MSQRKKTPQWTERFCPRIEKWVTVRYWIDPACSPSGGEGSDPLPEVRRFELADCSFHKFCGLASRFKSHCPFYMEIHPAPEKSG
jgi:hypothetical protein